MEETSAGNGGTINWAAEPSAAFRSRIGTVGRGAPHTGSELGCPPSELASWTDA